MVKDNLYTPDTNWMYTAVIQTALKGPEPVWSHDDWNLVPLPSGWEDPSSAKQTISTLAGDRSLANLTVQTPAIRARLEYSTLEWPKNLSLWLTSQNDEFGHTEFTLVGYIQLGNLTTRLPAQGDVAECCANLTTGAQYNPASMAYWTENCRGEYQGGTTGNFTVKWIRGPASFARSEWNDKNLLYFSEPPAIQAMNYMPIFESSRAEITVEPKTGVVQQYHILDTPFREDIAWSDTFQYRNLSEDAPYTHVQHFTMDNSTAYYYDVDTTTR
jgi:hypothetical protein